MFFKLIIKIYSNNVKVKIISMLKNENMLEMDFLGINILHFR